MIVTGASRARVAAEYEPALVTACGGIAELDPDASLYLYGSVANGTATPPGSDIDLLTIDLDQQLAVELASSLSAEFQALCRGVELAASASGDFVGQHDEAYGNRVFLRHYCVHLAGPSRHSALSDFPADTPAVRGFNGDIDRHLQRWKAALDAGDSPADLGRRAARKTLLALTGLVSVAGDTWTTDRMRAVERWSTNHPETTTDLLILVDWSDGVVRPTHDAVAQALDGIIATITAEFAHTIGLWNTR